jgi:hypothetical protein
LLKETNLSWCFFQEKNDRILVLERDNEELQKLLEAKDKEIRKLKKVALRLMEDLVISAGLLKQNSVLELAKPDLS